VQQTFPDPLEFGDSQQTHLHSTESIDVVGKHTVLNQ